MTTAEGKGKITDLKALSAGKSSDCSLHEENFGTCRA